MRKVAGLGLVAAVTVLMVAVAPAAAGVRTAAHMEVQTNFDPADDPFTADGIAGCSSGTVATGDNATKFPRTHGVFAGDKVFDCGGDTGFVVRLNALFSYSGGSIGTWSIVDSWGTVAGLQGSGKLVGTPTSEVSILDVYDGTIN
jgi:hypothetical protein